MNRVAASVVHSRRRWVHARRAVGRDRGDRDPGGAAAPSDPGRAEVGPSHHLHEQSQADRSGGSQFPDGEKTPSAAQALPSGGAIQPDASSTFVLLLPYLEEGNRYAGFDPAESVISSKNLPTTSGTVEAYVCPSMQFNRDIPVVDCSEQLGAGSYIISTRTDYASASIAAGEDAAMDGAFAMPKKDEPYSLSFQHFLDGTSKTFLVGEINFGFADLEWDCSKLAGQIKWGDQTWAKGYWPYAWGHISWTSYKNFGLASYNSKRGRGLQDPASVPQRSSRRGAVRVRRWGREFRPGFDRVPGVTGLGDCAGEEANYAFK